jgi:hypothetical protein
MNRPITAGFSPIILSPPAVGRILAKHLADGHGVDDPQHQLPSLMTIGQGMASFAAELETC